MYINHQCSSDDEYALSWDNVALRVFLNEITFSPHTRISGETKNPLSQVPVSACGEAHEEDVYIQRQRLHAAVRPAGQEAWVLVLSATGEVSVSTRRYIDYLQHLLLA